MKLISIKYEGDSAIKFPRKIDFGAYSLHRDHPPVLELKFYKYGETSSLRVLTTIANMF